MPSRSERQTSFAHPFFAARVFFAGVVPRLTAAFFRVAGFSSAGVSLRLVARFTDVRFGATRVDAFFDRTATRGVRFGTASGWASDSGAFSCVSAGPFLS
jgi:hypothetical protein